MAYGTSQNNNERKTINTNGYQFKNKDGFDPSALSFNYWGDLISFRINPALEPSKQTDAKVYDYEKFVASALTLDKAKLLLMKLETVIIPAIEASEDKSIAVSVGDSLIAMGTGKGITGNIRPYFAIHKALDPSTKKPEMSMYYEFNKSFTIDDYDPATGKYTTDTAVQSELYLFIDILRASIASLSHAATHSARNVNNYANDRLNANIIAIGEKVGANIDAGKSSRTSRSIPWGNSSSGPSEDSFPNSSAIENIDDINELMG